MTARLMTPFCFASLLAAALMADSAFADSFLEQLRADALIVENE